MTCARNTKRCPRTGPCCKRHLYHLLQLATEVFHVNNANYTLDSGTLLGCMREGGIIEIDTDVDISTTAEEFSKVRSGLAKLKGVFFKPKRNLSRLYLSRKNKLHLDIYIWYPAGDRYHYKCTKGVYTVPRAVLDNTHPQSMNGVEYLVSNRWKDILAWKYGDWTIPDKVKTQRMNIPRSMPK